MSTPARAAEALDTVVAAFATLKAKLHVDFSVEQRLTLYEASMVELAEYLRAISPG
jgi:hypothetical protein